MLLMKIGKVIAMKFYQFEDYNRRISPFQQQRLTF